jgi:hypothetical protein
MSADAALLDDVECWRVSQLVMHGCDFLSAITLAVNHDVDLHQACDLLVRVRVEATA